MFMPHPLVEQLRFTRGEWLRSLRGVTAEEAGRRFGSINCISWMVGHLAWQEQLYWLQRAKGQLLSEEVVRCASGEPPTSPQLDEMWTLWKTITEASDGYLDTLTSDSLQSQFRVVGPGYPESIGTSLRRLTYHYWFHIGEALAVRQLLGHKGLPEFVGDINQVPYRPEV
jgi:hypothetical protein